MILYAVFSRENVINLKFSQGKVTIFHYLVITWMAVDGYKILSRCDARQFADKMSLEIERFKA